MPQPLDQEIRAESEFAQKHNPGGVALIAFATLEEWVGRVAELKLHSRALTALAEMVADQMKKRPDAYSGQLSADKIETRAINLARMETKQAHEAEQGATDAEAE